MPDRSFNILLIEDNPGDARLMREYLADAGSCQFRIAWGTSVAAGLDLLAQSAPDLIVLDLNLPDSGGLDTFIRVHGSAGAVPILILSGIDDESVAIQAMRRGAQDYLVKGEVRGAALVRAIRYAIERDRAGKARKPATAGRARVIGFVGAKGGVGTSTVAANVTAALVRANRTVVVAEVRPSPGTLELHLNDAPPGNIADFAGMDVSQITPDEVKSRLRTLPFGGQALCAPAGVEVARPVEPAQVQALIHALQSTAEYVILDVLPYPAATAAAALSTCSYVAVVTGPDAVSLRCAANTAALLGSWAISRDRTGLIAVIKDKALEVPAGELAARSGLDVLAAIPPVITDADPGQIACPVVARAPESECAAAFVDLASRLASEPVLSMFVAAGL